MDKKDVPLYSWIIRGSQRRTILQVMDKPKTPGQIADLTHLKFSNVSDVLRAMVEKGLVECLNPNEKMGRLYVLTKKGVGIKKEIE